MSGLWNFWVVMGYSLLVIRSSSSLFVIRITNNHSRRQFSLKVPGALLEIGELYAGGRGLFVD